MAATPAADSPTLVPPPPAAPAVVDVTTPTAPTASPTPSPDTPRIPPPARRLAVGLGLSLLSGLLAVAAFEDHNVPALIWVAFVPAIVAQQRILPRRWSGVALGIAVGTMYQGYMGPGLFSSDLAWYFYAYGLWVGLAVALLTSRSRAFHVRTGHRWFVLATPLAWTAIDFVRTTLTEAFGGTWAMVAYAMYDRPAVLQPVSVTGIHGMNLLILLVNWALALGVLAWLDRRHGPVDGRPALPWPQARRTMAVVGGVLALWMGSSALMMASPPPTLRVAAVQPGSFVAEGPRRVPALTPEEQLARSVDLTRSAAQQGAQLVVWPEAGIRVDATGPDGAVFADLARELGIDLVVGWQAPAGDLGRFNETAAFSPAGELLGSYGKSHPGEFAGDYSARQGEYLIYGAEWGDYGTIICFDLDFTDSARRTAALGADVLAVASSDVPGIAEKHYTHLVFRAIETRLPIVKADSAFDSAVLDPYGRILDAFVAKDGAQAVVVADVPLGTGETLYVRWGEWFAWLAVAGTGALVVIATRARLAARRDG
jgi:apolipoprotein N-acyltransferase